jgi:hypothetical protein
MLTLRMVIGGVTDTVDHWWFVFPLAISGMGLGIGISALFQTILAGVPPRDAGAGSGALQAFQQVGGALGVALMGEIFFTSLTNGIAAGTANPHMPFVDAAENALIYEIIVFIVVAGLTPFLKGRDKAAAGHTQAAPIIIEA